jgi:hypothetical protein
MTPSEAFDILMTLPPVQWDEYQRAHLETELGQLVGELDDIAERAARLSTYLRAREYGDHAHAVKRQNTAAMHVRKALGFTYPRADHTF